MFETNEFEISEFELFKKREADLLNRLGNNFDTNEIAARVKQEIGKKKAVALYLGFNPVTYKGEIAIEVEVGLFKSKRKYLFVPLNESLVLAGGCWSDYVFMKLFYAQERLSKFLKELESKLNIPVVDRCLYIAFLDSKIYSDDYEKDESVKEYVLQKQEEFRQKYAKQLEDMKQFENWIAYHNHGFEFHYAVDMEIEKAINEIYQHRDDLEKRGKWEDARITIDRLNNLIKNRSIDLPKKYEYHYNPNEAIVKAWVALDLEHKELRNTDEWVKTQEVADKLMQLVKENEAKEK